jgi:hypothetical protein
MIKVTGHFILEPNKERHSQTSVSGDLLAPAHTPPLSAPLPATDMTGHFRCQAPPDPYGRLFQEYAKRHVKELVHQRP